MLLACKEDRWTGKINDNRDGDRELCIDSVQSFIVINPKFVTHVCLEIDK